MSQYPMAPTITPLPDVETMPCPHRGNMLLVYATEPGGTAVYDLRGFIAMIEPRRWEWEVSYSGQKATGASPNASAAKLDATAAAYRLISDARKAAAA
jgi:hypothetical protein